MTATAPEPRTVADLVLARAGDDHEALRFEERSWTWAEVVHECAAPGRAPRPTARKPATARSTSASCSTTCPSTCSCSVGAALAGATVVGINPTRRGDEPRRDDIRHTDCRLVVTEPGTAAARRPRPRHPGRPGAHRRIRRYGGALAATPAPRRSGPGPDPDDALRPDLHVRDRPARPRPSG